MSNGFKIGKIFGIDISIHWTLALLFFISLIPISYGDYLLFLIIILLFVCVFLHELAHSFTAIKNKIPVKEITLNIIGGASIIDITKVKPDIEFRIALVGPIASIFIGCIFGIFSVLYTSGGTLAYILQIMFEINVLLGIFNIIPAFPMDGGRVLKSYLQKKRTDFDSTILTAKISSVVIGLFLLFSFVYTLFITGSIIYKEFEFFILLFIAIFLYGGSQSEKESAIIKNECKSLSAFNVMGNDFSIISSTLSSSQIYKYALSKRQDILLIKENDKFNYIDPFKARNYLAKTSKEISSPAITVNYKETAFNVLLKLQTNGTGLAVVLKNNKAVGVITLQRIQSFIYLHMLANKSKKRI
ncbi:MAG: site-2 protease family protein [Candidatus Micrarchaeaceae archaeon]